MEIKVKQEVPLAERLEAERGAKPEVVSTRKELLERLQPEPGFTPITNKITAQHRTAKLHENGQEALVYAFSAFYEVPAHPGAKWITVNLPRTAPILMDSDTFELIKDQEMTMVNSLKSGIMRIDVLTEPTKAQAFLKRGTPRCQYCDTRPGTVRCSKCNLVRYCSAECQQRHWTERHAFACERLAKVTLAPAPKKEGITPEQASKLGAVSRDQLSHKLREKLDQQDLKMEL